MLSGELFQQLEMLRDEDQGKKMSAYMQNQFEFLGIPKPKLKEFIKPYFKQARKQPFDWGFVDLCWEKPYREAQYIAVDYIIIFEKKFGEKDFEHFKQLIINKSWWDTVDNLDEVIGLIVKKHDYLKSTMEEWSLSDNIWLRRVAIDFQQEYKEETDKVLLAKIMSNNFGSKEFFINKAIGWSLRDYSKVNPEWVKEFITKHEGEMDKLSLREAKKNLDT